MILLGSVFSFCYSVFTSNYFQRFSKGFYKVTGTTLSNRNLIAGISLVIGIFVFGLEFKFTAISRLMRSISYSLDTFNNFLLGVSLLLLFLDSESGTPDMSGLNPKKIDRVEITKVIQKITPEDSPKSD